MRKIIIIAVLIIGGWALASRALRGRRNQPETLREQAERLARDPHVQKKVKELAKDARKKSKKAMNRAAKSLR